ncbi:hypothetical protein SRABI70_04240 [Pseudomonas sp. Bi70]|nr:hypothetical protein SRABI70_04240 [Pseudomonas sp. Bi70]
MVSTGPRLPTAAVWVVPMRWIARAIQYTGSTVEISAISAAHSHTWAGCASRLPSGSVTAKCASTISDDALPASPARRIEPRRFTITPVPR